MEYILPIKSGSTEADDELITYLAYLAGFLDVLVVDGSDPDLVAARRRRWSPLVTYVTPSAEFRFSNGKVNGVLTGLRLTRAEKIVIADDDVRYDADGIGRIALLLDTHDLVVPQNYFDPMPWHARWDTARSLLNRLGPSGDFSGTVGLRRQDWLVRHGYDGDVLFENLELIRTVRARGGSVRVARGLYVQRHPPGVKHFLGQRVRQAYDSQAQPLRLVAELALLPVVVSSVHRPRRLALAALISVVAAECGRRRSGGRAVYPATAALLAPAWLAERALCSWLALGTRVTVGGIGYSGNRITRAAHSTRRLRGTTARVHALTQQPRAGGLVGGIAKRFDR